MVWGSGERKVDVCILHKSMVWCSPKLFSRSFIFGSNESHEEPGGRKMVEMFQLICHSRIIALQRGCYFNLHLRIFRWMFRPNSSKVERRQASKRWTESCRGRGLQSAPYLPFLISLNNLQFKEKKSTYPISHHQIMFFLYQRGEVQVVSCAEKPCENPLLTAVSVDIQHLSRLKGFGTPTDVFGTMGTQMRRPFTTC